MYHFQTTQRTIEKTADGSNTIYLPLLDEHYHSVKGALTESMHVFIDCGLHHTSKKSVRLLEIGFGTGLNALLTALDSSCRIEYFTVERFPLDPGIMQQTGYFDLSDPKEALLMKSLHQAPWDIDVEITPHFTIHKILADFTDRHCFLPDALDVVYFDAFAPEKQPEMWSEEIFRRIFSLMTPGGILTTYCAKGMIRRRLQAVGFSVERLPGPPGGKREIIRAVKPL